MTGADLAIVRGRAAIRTHRVTTATLGDGSVVVVKGLRADRGAWRAKIGNGLARAAGLAFLQSASAGGSADAQSIEVARLRTLRAAGLRVPEVLHVEPAFFVMTHIAGTSLIDVMEGAQGAALLWWRRGLQALLEVHREGQYLSQAFARNFIVGDAGLAMIDFEDDPGRSLTLDEAQARDWLAYLHSTTWRLPEGRNAVADELVRQLAEERPAVRTLVERAAGRLAWLRHLPATRKPFGREAVGLQALAALFHDDPRLARALP